MINLILRKVCARILTIGVLFAPASLISSALWAEEVSTLKKEYIVLHQKGNSKTLIKAGEKILGAIKNKFGEGHIRHIKMLDRLAYVYMKNGKNKRSEELLLTALKLSETKHGKDSVPALESHSSLAFLYKRQNRKAEALKHLAAAVKASEKVRGQDHLETIVMKNNLAWMQK